jgi:hypothetical protein
VAASQEVRSVDNVFRNATTSEEPSLVSADKGMDSPLKPVRKDFGNTFHDAVLEGDRSKLRRVGGRFSLGQEDQEGTVNAAEINGFVVEGRKHIQNIPQDQVPEGGEKGGAKAIRPRARKLVHGSEGKLDLRRCEGGAVTRSKGSRSRVEGGKFEGPGNGSNRPQKVGEKVLQGIGFVLVFCNVNPFNRKGRDSVAAKSTGRGRMEKLGVFISFKDIANFSPGPPVKGSLFDRAVEGLHSERTETSLRGRERPSFLQEVKKVDKDTTVLLSQGAEGQTPGPVFTDLPAQAKSGHQPSGGVRAESRPPGSRDR